MMAAMRAEPAAAALARMALNMAAWPSLRWVRLVALFTVDSLAGRPRVVWGG
jgi:hypothetical protein